MTSDEFKKLTDTFLAKTQALMHQTKAEQYAKNQDDRLIAFKRGGEVLQSNPETVCLAYMTKHYLHLVDMVQDGEKDGLWRTTAEWDEVLTDLINYCLLMRGLLLDGELKAEDRLGEERLQEIQRLRKGE